MARTPSGSERRQGRGRLSSIDLLPEEAEEDIVWVNGELRDNKTPQIVLLDQFNTRLMGKGITPISKSAFSRYSVRKADQFRQLDETRRISAELVEMLGTSSADQMTIAVAEMVKNAAFKVMEGGNLDSKSVMELARAVKDATSAQKLSADYRRLLEREFTEKVKEAAEDVEEIAKAHGVSDEAMRLINLRLAGIA